jgi:ABC-type glycerol-3-phosphate transport system substrate-binding protein
MRLKSILLIFTLVLLVVVLPVQAQSDRVITLGLSEFMRNVPIEEVLEEFEAQNPGVQVQIVYVPPESNFAPSPAVDINEHLDAVQTLAQAADVVLVNQSNLTPEAVQAGYFLNLAPLASADSSLNQSDFLPAAWESFRWANGQWALPAKIEPLMLIYDPAAFDAAGLTYPTGNWTMDDLIIAARTLTQYDESGEVTQPGLVTYGGEGYLLGSLYGQSLTDENGEPNLDAPELQALLDQWVEFSQESVISSFPSQNGEGSIPPMGITGSFGLFTGPMEEQSTSTTQPEATLLPGGNLGLEVQGIAISRGTLYPQEAYALAKFLTESPRMLNLMQGSRSARDSMTGSDNEPLELEGGMRLVTPDLPPEIAEAVEDMLPNALPTTALHFGEYVVEAMTAISQNGLDSATALEEAELAAVANLQTAADRQGTSPIVVATPIPEVVLGAGEVSLKFDSGFTPQAGEWERLMREFADADPQVGEVVLNSSFGDVSSQVEQNDCFYLNYNAVPSVDLSLLLSLDPLMSADTDFSTGDVAGNALSQLQRDNRTWAFPFVITPTMLNYHIDLFAQAGVAEPVDGWTTGDFVNALQSLKTVIPEEQIPFTNRSFGDTTLLVLIAAYGGLPLDFRTDPVTINFTDPTTVEAIRQVLDLAKEDLMEYQQLGGNRGFAIRIDEENTVPIYSDSVTGGRIARFGGPAAADTESPYALTAFPSGTYAATAYEIGAGYISATSQNADACYRLFKFLSQHPELFDGMPALRSQFSNATLLASTGQNAVDFYTQYDELMQNPDVVIIPSAFSGGAATSGMNIIRRWLDQAFDEYVLNDADLLAALTDAQTKAQTFQTCVQELPPYDATNPQVYQTGLSECATAVDPDAVMMFPIPAN